jgi:hypothetical protein
MTQPLMQCWLPCCGNTSSTHQLPKQSSFHPAGGIACTKEKTKMKINQAADWLPVPLGRSLVELPLEFGTASSCRF